MSEMNEADLLKITSPVSINLRATGQLVHPHSVNYVNVSLMQSIAYPISLTGCERMNSLHRQV
ncbi:hypothetical protein W02_36510 [Nitrospira sp. KM1]|nr:hypothetical protein W02_36510 [Nitrospira sp. KM1]